MRSKTFTVGGANIKGTPAMKPPAVTNDVRKISRRVDVLITQEFKWRWYWTIIRTMLGPKWGSYPAFVIGIAKPIFGAQGIFWKRRLFRRVTAKVLEAFDFGLDNGGIMDNRWVRALLLQEKKSKLQCWFISLHAVVHGDDHGEGDLRQKFMHQNLQALARMLKFVCRSDAPVVVEGDFNIHPGTWAYAELMDIVHQHGGRVVGQHGVEFMIVFDDHCKTKVIVEKNYVLTPKAAGLKTDHEVRCADIHLQN